ncbi:MAG: hypothetical protein K0R84_1685 [Clostridia bacterium]|jgi:uncharacterized protein (UPF0297 family)|nr:hypothetical protein [Clostridia bacterium]
MTNNLQETMKLANVEKEEKTEAAEILMSVYSSLKEKGYNPVNQIVGYILSGDPTYITSHNNARSMIKRLERDELLEELVKSYVRD